MFAATATLAIRHARATGTLAALASFLVIALSGRPPDGVLEALVVVLPALEVTLFAFAVAFALDEVPSAASLALRAFALWAAVCFLTIWLLVAATQASIEAYVRLGGPPMLGSTL
ncbi:hypothetical protein Plav_3167 [Parvibaculum lavamentivorans DS-1]|uniref:Uncharacterized protein n=1 Tax=Parvibaculum lavamentivorans (strain DS-1 / DSM 13023 / NCIMB 13966) TaxID=402881 RepID=A7HXZ0_PARL1|nr:hypothetical protein [Parvibaculum lavamentivorans]ABS64773.1 hypothetical protein Plav_3167 [Parvibaculum lavamentivorans DS-1]